MLKRVLVILTASVLAFVIAGCSSGTSSSASASSNNGESSVAGSSAEVSESASEPSSSSSPLFTDQSWPADEYAAEELPIPEFSVAPESIQTSDTIVSGTWKGVEDQEVVDYVAKLKDAGFTVRANESKSNTNYSYHARNSDDISTTSTVSLNYTASIDNNPSALLISVSRMRS